MSSPEDKARQKIDEALNKAGWKVQDYKDADLSAGRGIARVPVGKKPYGVLYVP